MTGFGILAGLLTAVLQSVSYICSAGFMRKYKSPLRLAVFSQLAMGAFCLPLLPFLFPPGLDGKLWRFFGMVAVWAVVFAVGQTAFFTALRSIEASRISSLLGLKILTLALIFGVILRERLNLWQWAATLLATVAAVGMNWSGGRKLTLKSVFWLVMTLLFYSFADMSETCLVTMPQHTGMIRAAFGVGVVCYLVLGLLTLPMLVKFRWTGKQFVMAIPFGACWLFSQIALFVCFGFLGTVFGNVVQSSRGLISIALGVLLMHLGLGKLDATIPRRMWIRRGVAAALMAAAIILYALAGRRPNGESHRVPPATAEHLSRPADGSAR